MRRIVVSAAFAFLGLGSVASAADMPVKALPAPVVPAYYDWSGFYIGVNGGWGWQDRRPDITVMNQFGTLATTTGLKASGGFGGGQAGYNWQQGPIVVGVEADIQGSSIQDSFSRIIDAAGDNLAASRNIDYFGTFRGRIGATVNNFLIYGTAGFAYAHVTNTELVSNGGLNANLTNGSTKTGIAVGGGVEYAFSRNWSVKAEYQYIGLPGDTLSAAVVPLNGVIVTGSRLTDNFQTVRVGVNYRFGAPVVAKY